MVGKQVTAGSEEVVKSMKPEVRQQWQELAKADERSRPRPPPAPPTAMTLTDVGPAAPPTHLLKRGDWRHPGKELTPGFLSALDSRPARIPEPKPGATTTGRRAELARWLTSADNPLTARVMVNRLWQGHFGRGIVATPSDFGAQGEPPTHPELLDWLATEFIDRGWSIKADAPADGHVGRVSASVQREAFKPPIRTTGCWGIRTAVVWKARRCATRCWRYPGCSMPGPAAAASLPNCRRS